MRGYNSILFYLNKLQEPVKTKAIENYNKDIHFKKDKKVISITEALQYSFVFMNTPEGIEYWTELHERFLSCKHHLHGSFEDTEEGIDYLCSICALSIRMPQFD